MRKKKSVDKIIEIARMRIGESGYNIFYNNCEHFAFQCVFGENKSEQVSKYSQLVPFVDVYYARIPKKVHISKIYPTERENEINSCANELIKVQKFYVWKLLEIAVKKSFNLLLKNISFIKKENGQWVCSELFFSLSHSADLVAVSVSNYPTGIDIELLDNKKFNEGILEKILSNEEQNELKSLSMVDYKKFFITKWTQKESEFKRLSKTKFEPQKTITSKCYSDFICLDKQSYILSVAGKEKLYPRKFLKIKLK